MTRLLLVLLLLSSPALAWYPSQLWQGDQAMRSDKPAEAEKFYRQALKEKPEDARATYNLATSLYRQGQYKEAGELFHRLVEARDPEFVGRAAYNEGNALFQQKKNDEALEAYKVALRWNELDDDARYNIEQLLKQKNQNPNDKDKKNQDKDKDKDKDKNKDKDKDQQDKQDKNQDKQDKNQDKDKNKDKDKDKNKDQNKDDQDKKDKDQSKQPQPQEPQMSKQDAERLLQYFQQKEDKDAPKARVRQARPPKGTETW